MEKNCFDLEKIIDDIVSIEKESDYDKRIEIFLIALKKTSNEIYKVECDSASKKVLFDSLKSELNKSYFKNREVIDYDVINNKKNTHELVRIRDYKNIADELKKIDDEENQLASTKGKTGEDFSLYMVSIHTQGNTYKLFGSFSGILKLKKKYLFGAISIGNMDDSKISFKKYDDVTGFNKKIDLLIINNQFLLINQAQAKFENLFKMDSFFSKIAVERFKSNYNLKKIFSDNTKKKLISKLKTRKTLARKFIKITNDKKRFDLTLKNIDRFEEIRKNKEFSSKVENVHYENGQLTADSGKESQLIDALSDSSYTADVSNVRSIDKTRI